MSEPQKKKPTPADPSSAYLRMKPRWDMADALLGGTETMRAAAEVYLPQHEQETHKNYRNRLERATLLNMTEMVLEALVGKPFSKPIVLEDDVPASIKEWSEDFDLQGNNLQSFARGWFREGWAKGLSHVLIDFPVLEVEEDPERPRTLDDDRRQNLRPFAVQIRPENIVAAYAETINGQERLTHVRIQETTLERSGWSEVLRQSVRVLEPGSWAVYEPAEKGDEWVLVDEGTTPLDVIPLVTFYAGKKEGVHECKPPLTDLMHLNVAHWQSSSDQRNVLTVARFPILAGSGVGEHGAQAIGPNNFLSTDAPEGKWYYVEHTGAAIEAGRTDLQDLQDQMAGYGAEFLKRKVGGETATARALDSAEGMSYLQATALDFKDAVEQALHLMALWARLETGGSATVYSDFASGEAAAEGLEQLLKLRAQRDISRLALLKEFQRRGLLSDDFDPDEDEEQREAEAEAGADNMGGMFGGGEGTQGGGRVPPGADPAANPDEEEEEEEEES